MKCTECGKNIAVYHYVSDINGEVTEAHLCEECARKAKEKGGESVWENFDRLMEDSFNSFFEDPFMRGITGSGRLGNMLSGRSLLDSFFEDDFFASPTMGAMMLPAFFFPTRRPSVDSRSESEANEKDKSADGASKAAAAKKTVDEALSKRRQIQALKEQMHRAARAEDYEKAAKLRDEIKALENRAD